MADKKITALDDLGSALASVDLFHIVDDPSNTPINKKVTAKNVFNNIPTYIGLAEASETLTNTDTAINTTSAISEVNQTAGSAAMSLADGTDGQIKTIIATGTGAANIVITPTNLRGGSTITLNAEGETVQCLFKNSKWNVIGGNGFVVN
mgnify:CR=1 FL=1|tara:strand:+ start:484 stop:933 length:450 start_codon:yes stop_codon:yes gene_type:complete